MKNTIKTKDTGTLCLVSNGSMGRKIACGVTKVAVTGGLVTAGFFGGDALKAFIMEKTENALAAEIVKYGTVLVSAIVANLINTKIDKSFKYTDTTVEEIKSATIKELQNMSAIVQPIADVIPPEVA